MIVIDGAMGEGGGQILRSSLALSMVTGQALRVTNIRAARKKPGLMRQHLTAVEAAARVSSARVKGAAIGSIELEFRPGPTQGGEYHFAIGTAGSTTLVAQTILPALLTAPAPSRLVLEGGTHNPLAPPFEFLDRVVLPLISRMGPRVKATLERPGFAPAGGGRMVLEVEPAPRLAPFDLLERGEIRSRRVRVLLAGLPRDIASREVDVLKARTGWEDSSFSIETPAAAHGPGNVILIELGCDHVTEIISSFGERGVAAEAVAEHAVEELRRYLRSGAPVGEHLADQLLLPLALAGGGSFRAVPLTRHATTQIELIGKFIAVDFSVEREPAANVALVRLTAPAQVPP